MIKSNNRQLSIFYKGKIIGNLKFYVKMFKNRFSGIRFEFN